MLPCPLTPTTPSLNPPVTSSHTPGLDDVLYKVGYRIAGVHSVVSRSVAPGQALFGHSSPLYPVITTGHAPQGKMLVDNQMFNQLYIQKKSFQKLWYFCVCK